MSAHVIEHWVVVCDRCDKQHDGTQTIARPFIGEATESWARQIAGDAGWVFESRPEFITDLCPKCAVAAVPEAL